MYTEYCTGLLTIWWPRWRQFTKVLKWSFPIFLHYIQWSVIDMITGNPNPLSADFASTTFTASISFMLLHYSNILPEYYQPQSRYLDTLFQVIVQILWTDIAARLIGIPLQYLLYYVCINGYLGKFVERFLPFIYIFDGYIPVTKFVRNSTNEQGFQQARIALGYIQLFIGIIYSRFYLRLFRIYRKIQCYVSFLFTPIVKELKNRGFPKRSNSSSSKCRCKHRSRNRK